MGKTDNNTVKMDKMKTKETETTIRTVISETSLMICSTYLIMVLGLIIKALM